MTVVFFATIAESVTVIFRSPLAIHESDAISFE